MSTTPEGDAAGQRGGTQHDTPPGAPPQAGAPGQEQYGGTPYGQVPPQARGREYGSYPGRATPVPRGETRVTGRRVVQYLIDSFLVGIIPSLVSIPFDQSNSTWIHVVGGIVAFVVFVIIGFAYWVVLVRRMEGQTLAMKLVGIRVISKSGGQANMAQLTIRWVCLILDAIPYTWPFTGLVGFIVILLSRDRQRIGDHLARTLVIATDARGLSQTQYADTDLRYAGTDPRYAGTDTRYTRTDSPYAPADTGQPPMEPRQQSPEAKQPPPPPDQPGMQPGKPGEGPSQQ